MQEYLKQKQALKMLLVQMNLLKIFLELVQLVLQTLYRNAEFILDSMTYLLIFRKLRDLVHHLKH